MNTWAPDHRIRGATILVATSGLLIGILGKQKVSEAIEPVGTAVDVAIDLLIVGSALAIAAAWPRRREPATTR